MKRTIFLLLFFVSCFSVTGKLVAAEIEQLIVVTDKIIIVHFDEGDITYPNTIDTVQIDIEKAIQKSNYFITSSDDPNYSAMVEPSALNRRTFGTKFQSNSGGIWAGNRYDPTGKPWVTEHWIYLTLPIPMTEGSTYTVNTSDLAETNNDITFTYNVKTSRSEAVHVNTIGYSKDAPKYGYVHHWAGDMGGVDFSAYDGNAFNVYNVNALNTSLASGQLTFRKAADNVETSITGDTPDQNFLGSEVYECDFSSFKGGVKGEKYILVVDGLGCSYPFEVGEDAMWDAYYYGIKGLYHQRSGIRLDAPFAHPGYYRPVNQNPLIIDNEHANPAFQSISFEDRILYSTMDYSEWDDDNSGGDNIDDIIASAEGNPVNVAGWYHDAGDWDSYAHHHKIPGLLMLTYEYFPERFGDDELTIPESENGIPDIVDEASWLVKFNYRLRRELINEGYSTGGVGGARICSDIYNQADGKAEGNKPSWQDHRRIVVTKADAYMTYYYAGQAAHLAYVLKGIGKDPKNFPVENLDAISFDEMTKDTVNFIQEAKDAYEWASLSENQPLSENHPHLGDLAAYRLYAAAALYRLTGESKYHSVAKTELNSIRTSSDWGETEMLGAYIYLNTQNFDIDQDLISDLQTAAKKNGELKATQTANERGCRNGGLKSMPMLIGQATTPWMFEAIMAFKITGDQKFEDVAHTTADYYLGNNPRHTTWMVNVGPRAVKGGFHLDTKNTGSYQVYPGWIPYGPWSIKYSNPLFTWSVDGIDKTGGMGVWSEQWANYSVFPVMEQWPGHERWNNNIHAPLYAENTIHQNTVHAGITYGFVNGRNYTNSTASNKINLLTLNEAEIKFTVKKEQAELTAIPDIETPICAQLVWSSSDENIAHVNGFGMVTAIGNGTATITCSTLDGSVSTTCNIICDNLADVPVESIEISAPDTLYMGEGERINILVKVFPENATLKSYSYSSTDPLIAEAIDDQVIAYAPGEVKISVTADADLTISDSIVISVRKAGTVTIVDFDEVIPVTGEPQPFIPQFFSTNDIDIQAANPLVNGTNSSATVVQMNKSGTWKIVGVALPTKEQPRICKYSEVQFKYYGAGINHLMVVANYADGSKTEVRQDVIGADDWQLFSFELADDGFLKQVLVFPNPEDGTGFTCYFDDFRLVEDFTKECLGQILITSFEKKKFNWADGTGAFCWASSNCGVVENPSPDVDNPTLKVFHWRKDPMDHANAPMTWGGFGLDFTGGQNKGNETNTVMWESLEFMVYSTETFSRFKVDLKCNAKDKDDETYVKHAGSITFDSPIIANQWNWVSFKFSELDEEVPSFNYLVMTPAGGEDIVSDIYIDSMIMKGFAVQNISISGPDNYQKGIGDLFQLNASISPIDADQELFWMSTNPGIASVDATGLVETKSDGTVYIKAISKGNPKLADSVEVVVQISVANIAIEGDPVVTIRVEEQKQFNVIFTPANTTQTDITWSSSNTDLAIVDENGMVSGIAEGTVIITATSDANPVLQASVVVKISKITGLIDNDLKNLRVYPNPVQNEVHIQCDQFIEVIDLLDVSGNVIRQHFNLDQRNITLNFEDVSKGCYILKITGASGFQINQIIIVL